MENVVKKYEGTYEEFHDRLGSELQKEAESFVRIGYLLKVARDSDILAVSGYKSVTEFAAAEYKLTKDVVSRYMAINDRYSEGGYSDVLQEQYRVYGYTKLAEMLTLPQEIADAVPPEATRAEIQDLKREIREEEQVSPMEVMMEQRADDTDMPLLYRMLKEYYHGKPAEYERVHEAVYLWGMQADGDVRALESATQDILAPSGNIVMMSRVPGIGRVMLVVRDSGLPELREIRSGEVKKETWQSVWEAFRTLVSGSRESVEDAWELLYGEPYPMAAAVREERESGKGKVIRTSSASAGSAPKAPDRSVTASGKTPKKAVKGKQAVPESDTNPGKNARKPEKNVIEQAESVQKAMESDQEEEEPEWESQVLEAERLAHVVLDALSGKKFMSARRAARALIEKIAEICNGIADEDIEGQMRIEDLDCMREASE